MAKRASASPSSGQPSQPKRPCLAPTGQVWNGPERNLVPGSCSTEEDGQRVCGKEPERAKSHSAEYCQSTGNALKDITQLIHSVEKWMHSVEKWKHSMEKQMHSMDNSIQELKDAVELAIIHFPHVGRSNPKSTAKNDGRNLQLHVQTKLSLPLFTGKKLEGEGGAHIYVALIDMKTGGVVTSGAESSIKLDVVVLEGDFNKDDEENWTQEEFENYMVKEREGKRPLLTGNLQVTLKEGVGQLGKLTFTDNSSWNRSKSFRIGLMVASGYCGNTRILEGITDAFSVREHRGESYMKHRLPASDDEVWRLEKIAKAGKSHQKLSEAGIHRVEDFLLQLFTDSQYLREILGKSITPKNWDILVDHAKTCKTNWKLYLSYSDGMRKHGAVFNTDGQLIGLIKDRVSFATDRLSAQDKEDGDAIVKKALANWNDVREFGGKTFTDSMQKNRSSLYSSEVFDGQIINLNPVQRYLAPPIFAAPVGPEAPLANVSSTTEGLNGATALALPVQSQNTNSGNSTEITVDESFRFAARQPMPADCSNVLIPPGYHGSTTAESPTQCLGIHLQNAMCCQTIGSSNRMDYAGYDNGLSSEPSYGPISSFQSSRTLPLPEGNHVMEDFESIDPDDVDGWLADSQTHNDTFDHEGNHVMKDLQSIYPDDEVGWLADSLPYNDTFDHGIVRGTSRGVIGWLKIKAVLQWGFFIRKRGVRIIQLDEPPTEVRAC